MVNVSTLRALSRISPKMFAYQLKRVFRNHFARVFPSAYGRYIEVITAKVPTLSQSPVKLDMARVVACFYYDEYIHHIDEAARGQFTFFGQTVDFGSAVRVGWHHQVPAERISTFGA